MRYTCVLYQVFGSYDKGLQALGLDQLNDAEKRFEHGFTFLVNHPNQNWSSLTEEWKRQVNAPTFRKPYRPC